ncbi:22203_t:CDS:2 [Gigaspora margarita]|uniref:22203_t:CDS:1 n=1 Tax=Gigaspora margarita TaxID=4874 RepID=A0ABN7VK98_GIGMA|nr:22203_t:CDS:2 [Gigaspora margarita]
MASSSESGILQNMGMSKAVYSHMFFDFLINATCDGATRHGWGDKVNWQQSMDGATKHKWCDKGNASR